MKLPYFALCAAILGLSAMSAHAATPKTNKAVPLSAKKAEADTEAMGEWMSRLLSAQSRAIGVLTPIDNAWLSLEQASDIGDQEAINHAHSLVEGALASAKIELEVAASEVNALPSLAGNSAMAQLPPGHEGRLRQMALESIGQFAKIVDRGETMALAAATGEQQLRREFEDLMLDARGEVLTGQIARIGVMTSATKKGSMSETKLQTLGKTTEALLIIFKGQVNIIRSLPAEFDYARLTALGMEVEQLRLKGHQALKAEKAQFGRERPHIFPALVAPIERMLVIQGEWVSYVDGLPELFNGLPAKVRAAGDDLVELDKVYLLVAAVEEEYDRSSQKLVKNMQGI